MTKYTKDCLFILSVFTFLLICTILYYSVNASQPAIEPTGYFDAGNIEFDSGTRISLGQLFKLSLDDTTGAISCYSLNLTLPEGINDIAIRVPSIDNNLQLNINDDAIYYNGVGDSNSDPAPFPHVILYHTDSNSLNLKIYIEKIDSIHQIRNLNPFVHSDFYLGTPESIQNYQNFTNRYDLLIFSICLLLFVFQLAMYFFRRDIVSHLYIAIMALGCATNVLVCNQRILHYYFDMDIYTMTRVDFVSMCIVMLMFLLLTSQVLKNYLMKTPFVILWMLTLFGIVVCIISSVKFNGILNMYFYLLSFFIITISIINAIFAHRESKDSNCAFFLCELLLIIFGYFTDFFSNLTFVSSYSLFFPAILLFIIIYNLRISNTYAHLYKNISKLTPKLKSTVFEMQNNRSTYINSHIKPDYLYETLEVVHDSIDKDQEKVDLLIQSLSKYLRQVLDYTEENEYYTLSKELDFCKAYIDIVKEQHPEYSFKLNTPENIPNVILPRFSIQALVENAVLHAFIGILHPHVTVDITVNGAKIDISVSDNGIGMSNEEIVFALENPTGNINIGLYHINKMLEEISSTLEIKSKINKYTTVSFSLGIQKEESV